MKLIKTLIKGGITGILVITTICIFLALTGLSFIGSGIEYIIRHILALAVSLYPVTIVLLIILTIVLYKKHKTKTDIALTPDQTNKISYKKRIKYNKS